MSTFSENSILSSFRVELISDNNNDGQVPSPVGTNNDLIIFENLTRVLPTYKTTTLFFLIAIKYFIKQYVFIGRRVKTWWKKSIFISYYQYNFRTFYLSLCTTDTWGTKIKNCDIIALKKWCFFCCKRKWIKRVGLVEKPESKQIELYKIEHKRLNIF